MSTNTMTATQVHQVYIRATPEAIWDAITKPEWTERYGYGGLADYDLRPGGSAKSLASQAMKDAGAAKGWPVPDEIVDGEVIEADPPRRLVQTWKMLMDPELEAEGFTRVTYDIEAKPGGVSKLTVTHELEGKPKLQLLVSGQMGEMAGGGWPWVLSDLKTLLESGTPMIAGEWLGDEN
jgi:uncharacterized protein YndB with AHSA1/START domain